MDLTLDETAAGQLFEGLRVTRDQVQAAVVRSGARRQLHAAHHQVHLRGLHHCAFMRQELDIADARAVQAAIEQWQPWAVVNAAGYVRVDKAEGDEEQCYRVNVTGPAVLAAVRAALAPTGPNPGPLPGGARP